MTNRDPLALGRTARVVQFLSQVMFRMGIDHEITYWFWKILVFPGRPLFPGDAVPISSLDAYPRPGRGQGRRAVYILKRG